MNRMMVMEGISEILASLNEKLAWQSKWSFDRPNDGNRGNMRDFGLPKRKLSMAI